MKAGNILLCGICGVGTGVLLHHLINHESVVPYRTVDETKKYVSETQSSYDDLSSQDAQQKWGTREGIIEVYEEPSPSRERVTLATREGIMEIADDSLPAEESSCQQEAEKLRTREGVMEAACEAATEKEQQNLAKKMLHQRKLEADWQRAFYNHLLRTSRSVLLPIANTSGIDREINLWGSNTAISPVLPEDTGLIVAAQIPTGIHPHGVVVNGVNDLVYVANQLSNTVTVLTREGAIVTTVTLAPSAFPGTNSPVALAVHTLAGRPAYGNVYVAGSVADTVSVINLNHEVTSVIQAGTRPVAIAFNLVNERLYVANLASDSVSVIDTVTEQVTTELPVGTNPTAISVNPENGDTYILNAGANSLTIYNSNNILVTTIDNVGNAPVGIVWHPAQRKMLVCDRMGILPVSNTYIKEAMISGGPPPLGSMAYSPSDGFLYVINSGEGTVTALSPDLSIQANAPAPCGTIGLASDTTARGLFYSATQAGTLNILRQQTGEYGPVQTDAVTLADSLAFFRHNPATIQHLKLIVSGNQRIRDLTIVDTSVTGTQNRRMIPLGNYESPQHFQKVYEITALKNMILDGTTFWRFILPAYQRITLLLYYQAFERSTLVPEIPEEGKPDFQLKQK